MPAEFLIKGAAIGLIFGIPIGAVGAMTVQRTLNYGLKAGLLTGLGSSAADCLYACVGAFGLGLISDFLIRYQTAINLLGGSLISIMGLRFLYRKKAIVPTATEAGKGVKTFLSSFAVGLTNPAAILTFLFAFSYFGIAGRTDIYQGMHLVCGVFIGTYFWWGILSIGTNSLRRRSENPDYSRVNRIFGIILILFGLSVFLKTIL